MPRTKLVGFINGQRIIIGLNAGDIIIARGDFIHAGHKYKKFNVRLHWCMDYEENGRLEDSTHPAEVHDYRTLF